MLLAELEQMGSLLVECARATAVPAGGALAVDRQGFSAEVTRRLLEHPGIELIREEVKNIPEGVAVIASGPLTSERLAAELIRLSGEENLYFFDAISPIVEAGSVDRSIAFRESRYGRGSSDQGDYLNCPMNKAEYVDFVAALLSAERIPLRSFESAIEFGVRAGPDRYFEACLPIEVLAERGEQSLAYGPLRPVGLSDPRTERRPYAVVQLRQDDLAGSLYNLVGFQTNLKFPEQRRVFRMIPGLQSAQFARYGQMHRNTFVNSPKLLLASLQLRTRSELLLAGQITGVEGYLGNIGTGLLAGMNAARLMEGEPPQVLPPETMLGALCNYVSQAEPGNFQPMKANFGILPPLGSQTGLDRRGRARAFAERGAAALLAAELGSKAEMRIAMQEGSS
jgi:methylenetetrahydrofolate--tRNA-(uracil-5-)-methyltransferase